MLRKFTVPAALLALGALIAFAGMQTRVSMKPTPRPMIGWPPDTIWFTRVSGTVYRASVIKGDSGAVVKFSGFSDKCPPGCIPATMMLMSAIWPPDTTPKSTGWPPDTTK